MSERNRAELAEARATLKHHADTLMTSPEFHDPVLKGHTRDQVGQLFEDIDAIDRELARVDVDLSGGRETWAERAQAAADRGKALMRGPGYAEDEDAQQQVRAAFQESAAYEQAGSEANLAAYEAGEID